jgi:hypothetical protein
MPTKDTVSDKDVEKAQTRVEKLRQQVADEKVAIQQAEAARTNAVNVATFDVESARLEAELAALKEQRKISEAPIAEDVVVQQLSETQEELAAQELAADQANKEK